MGDVFGNIFDADQLEQAVLAMLKERYQTWLDEVAQQRGRARGAYKTARTWTTVNDFASWDAVPLPCVLIISPGMVDEPRRNGDGTYTARWYVATAVIVSAKDVASTRKLAMRYGAALRACMLQNKTLNGALDGKARVVDWISEDYDDIDTDDSKTLATAKNIFTIEVDDVVNTHRGPTELLPNVDSEGDPIPPAGPVPDGEPPHEPEPGEVGTTPDYGDVPTVDPDKLRVDVEYIEDGDDA